LVSCFVIHELSTSILEECGKTYLRYSTSYSSMCGRFSIAPNKQRIPEDLKKEIPLQMEIDFSYNVAPTQLAPVITNLAPHTISKMHWGLLPSWLKDPKLTGKMINARAEGIFGKPSFRMPIRKTRCLVLADSFYEWRKEGNRKKPYRILPQNEELMTFAGIWTTWGTGNSQIESFAIITCAANSDVADLHTRMPVILNTKEQREAWMSEATLAELETLILPPKAGYLKMYRISELVNSPSYNSSDLHETVYDPPTLF